MKEELSFDAKQTIRRGYYKLHRKFLDEKELINLNDSEKSRYFDIGTRADKQKTIFTYVGLTLGVIVLIVMLFVWWQSNNSRKAREEAIENTPTHYNSPTEFFSATFPNKPHEIRNNPDESDSKSVTEHHEVVSGNSGNGIYIVDVVRFKPPFDELDCMKFLGDLEGPKENLELLKGVNLSDGRPTLNYKRIVGDGQDAITARVAVLNTVNTNICYRFLVSGSSHVSEKEFKNFLATVQIKDEPNSP